MGTPGHENREKIMVQLGTIRSICWLTSLADGAGQIPRATMMGTLAESLATEKQRLQEARDRYQELVGLLEQQKAAYPQVRAGRKSLAAGLCVW